MLTPREQDDIVKQARVLAATLMALRVRHRRGEMSNRGLEDATRRAELKLKDFLKDTG